MNKKRLISAVTALIMLMNIICPYIPLLKSISFAATTTARNGSIDDEEPFILHSLGITTKGANRILNVDIAMSTQEILNGFDFQFKTDTTKLKLCNKATGAVATALTLGMTSYGDTYQGTIQTKTYTASTGTFHFMATEPQGGIDITSEDWGGMFTPGSGFSDEVNVNGAGFDYYYPVCKLSFKIMDNSLTEDNLVLEDLFQLVPQGAGLPTGLKLSYKNASDINVSKDLQLAGVGFSTPSKTVTSIAVDTNPSKVNYEHGDAINLAGGKILVTYDDASTEVVDMTDSKVSISSGSPANVNSPTVTLSYSGQTTSFPITVTDPVTALSETVSLSALNQAEYQHGAAINFSGVTFVATRKSGATETLTTSSTGLSVSETTASVNSSRFTQTSAPGVTPKRGLQKLIYTYEGKSVNESIVVNDAIVGIELTAQPTKTKYRSGEALDTTGATVKVNLESGDSSTISLPDGSISVTGYNSTSTGAVQHLTVSYNTFTATATIDVEAYDYVTGSNLTAPTKDVYEVGEPLNVGGGKLRLNWKSGKTDNINVTNSMVSNFDSSVTGQRTLTVTHNLTYTLSDGSTIADSVSKTYEIEVVDSMLSITAKDTPTTCRIGQNLDLTGAKVTVTKSSGSSDIAMTQSMLSGLDNTTAGNQTVTVTYGADVNGNSLTDTFNVTVKDYTDSIKVSSTTTPISGNYGDTLAQIISANGITYSVKKGSNLISGATSSPLTASMVTSTYNPNSTSAQTLTVEYTDTDPASDTYNQTFTDTFTVTLANNTTGVDITPPTKIKYKYGESLALSDGVITIHKANGTDTTTSITAAYVTEADGSPVNMTPTAFGSDNTVSKTLKISYTDPGGVSKTVNYPITIVNNVTGIAVHSTNHKTKYNVGDAKDVTNLEIAVTRAVQAADEIVPVTAGMITAFDTSAIAAAKPVEITFTENGYDAKTTYDIQVVDEVQSIAINNPPTEVKFNSNLDLTGTTLTVTKGSGVTTVPGSAATYTFDKLTLGTQPVTVTYGTDLNGDPVTTTFNVEVKDYVTGITVTPASVNGKYNDELSTLITDNNIQYTVNYAKAGPQAATTLVDTMVTTAYDKTKTIKQTLTVSYTDTDATSMTNGQSFTTNFDVTLADYISSVTIVPPTKTNYNHGESLDLTGGSITVNYASGKTPLTPSMTGSMIKEGTSNVNMTPASYDATNKVDKTLTIKYVDATGKDWTESYPISIINNVTGITVHQNPTKTSYELGESLDKTGLEIEVTRAVGTPEIISDTSKLNVTGFNSSVGDPSQTLTVEYTENGITNSDTFDVEIKDSVDTITVTPPSKVLYNHGEGLDLTGGSINVHTVSGADRAETMLESMITESDGVTPVSMTLTAADYSSSATPNKVHKQLKIKYTEDGVEGNANYDIDIINDVKSIAVNSTTHETNYVKGATLSVDNLTIEVTRAVGTETIPVTADMVSGFDSSAAHTNLPLTITYEENGITKTTTYNINVLDSAISRIEVNNPPTTGKVGQPLDLTGATIKAYDYAVPPHTTEKPLEISMIKSYDNSTTGTKTVTVAYGKDVDGNDVTATFQVEVKDYVKEIKLNQTSLTGNYNDELSSLITPVEYTVVYAEAGDQTPVALSTSMLSSSTAYDKTSLSKQTLTFEYTDNDANSATNGQVFTANLDVELSDYISSIDVTKPTKENYNHGESLDLTGGTIMVNYASGAPSKSVTMDMSMITESDGVTAPEMSPATYDSTNKLSKTLVIKYEEDGVTGTVNYPITITNDLKSIAVNSTNHKIDYKLNEAKDVNNLTIEVTRAVGTETVAVTDDMVTGFTSATENPNLPLTITYTENGVTKTTTYNVSVADEVQSISIENAPESGYYGRELPAMTMTVVKLSGTTTGVTVSKGMISGYDKTQLGPQTVTVRYGGKQDSFTYEVKDYVTGLNLTNPTNTNYNYGDPLDLRGGKVSRVMASGATPDGEGISLTALPEGSITGYNPTQEGTQTVTVSYGTDMNGNPVTKTFTVTVTDSIDNISIKTAPNSTVRYGDPIDLTGAELNVKHAGINGATDVVAITSDMLSGFDPSVLGPQTVTVTYKDKTTTFNVNVEDYVDSIEVTAPTKEQYKLNEATINLAGGKITKKMASGAEEDIDLTDPGVTISGFETATEGTKTITVEYEGKQDTFNVIVKDEIANIQVTSNPTKTTYKYGENIDVTGGKITIIKESGATEQIPITSDMLSGYNPNTLGSQIVTVTYKGKTASFGVTVNNYLREIKVTPPTKTIYQLNETPISLAGGKVEKLMADGSKVDVPLTDSGVSITGFNTATEGTKIITVTCDGKQDTFTVTVNDPLSDIQLASNPTKTTYKYGETIDPTGGKITITKESGATETVNITRDMISGYNPNKLGSQVVTVTYKGKTTTFGVDVEDYLSTIKFTKPTKSTYKINDSLNLDGGKLTEVMASGAKTDISLLDENVTVSKLDSSKVGTKTITVTYKGKNYNFTVNVEDKIVSMDIVKYPSKKNYDEGQAIDPKDGEIKITRESGAVEVIPMTSAMLSGYDANKAGMQEVTVTYNNVKLGKYNVRVIAKVKPSQNTPSTPSDSGTTGGTNTTTPVRRNPRRMSTTKTTNTFGGGTTKKTTEIPNGIGGGEDEPTPTPVKKNQQNISRNNKADEKTEGGEKKFSMPIGALVGGILGAILLIFFIILLVLRKKNVKIIVEEDGELVLGGKQRVSKRDLKVDVDECLDEDTYPNRAQVILTKHISKKLDGKELEIKHRDEIHKVKIDYNKEPFMVELPAIMTEDNEDTEA